MVLRFWKPLQQKAVRQDWHANLPTEKLQVYDYARSQTERAHTIFSMALDEALVLRRSGKHEMAREQADVSSALCLRFAAALECLLDVVERYADSFGLLPSVKPLDPAFFRGGTAKRAAATNALLSNVLFKQSTCFLHKVKTLGEMAGNIAEEYRMMAAEVSEGASSKQEWDHLSCLQYDLTSSLSEAKVVLKSFIVSLPSGQVIAFRDRLARALLAMPATSLRPPKRAPQRTSQDTLTLIDRRAPAFRRE